ncbi:MAG: DNA repair protein RecO [Spirochaetota bacterium]|jgi:DNA repair protein RecO (recombination protein O)|nr:DNA repair protein RecO [Spirochaetota bacterium]
MSFKRNEKLRALALSSRPQGESHRLVALLCEDGRYTLGIAHGVRKPGSRFAAALEPASLSLVSIRRSRADGLASLADAELIEPFARIKEELKGLEAVFEFLSLVQYVCRYDSGDTELFARALELLRFVNADTDAIPVFLPLARVMALRHLGRMPDTVHCNGCRERPPDRMTAAGAFCAVCQEALGGSFRPYPEELRQLLLAIGQGMIPAKDAPWIVLNDLLKWLIEVQDEGIPGTRNAQQNRVR